MIDATDAKEMSKHTRKNLLGTIEQRILEATNRGKFRLRLPGFLGDFEENVLKEKGFLVNANKGDSVFSHISW